MSQENLLPKLKETSLSYMLKLAAPMIITNISFTVMQFVDRMMVSRLGTEALAAILPAGVITFVPASFILGMTTSVNTFVSQSLGKDNKENCSSYCWQAIYMGFLYFAIVLAVMWPSAEWIFSTMGYSPEVVEMEVTYLRINLYAQFPAVLIWSISQFFMGIHRPIITMYASIIGQLVNIFFNYLLIFGNFGFPEMGIAGAGWGTFIGINVGAGIRVWAFLYGDIRKQFNTISSCRPDLEKIKGIIRIGFPAGLGFTVNVVGWGLILFTLVAQFGTKAQAATSAVFSCINVSVMPVIGLSAALTAAVGKSIGTGSYRTAVKQTHICLKLALTYMGIMGVCFMLFREPIMRFWAPADAAVMQMGCQILFCVAIFQIFDAASIIYHGALRGAGDNLYMVFASAFSVLFFLGMGGFCMVKFFPSLGVIGPWIALTVHILVSAAIKMLRFKSNHWRNIDIFNSKIGMAGEIDASAIE